MKVFAPFTPEQVENLNDYQDAGVMHPFTCGGEHVGSRPHLIATPEGWVCPDANCLYRQNWAHAFMGDGSWKNIGREIREIRDLLKISNSEDALDER